MNLSVTIIDEASLKVPVIFRGEYEETIESAAKIGYKGIELHLDDPSSVDEDKLIRLLQHNNVSITSIGTGPGYGRRGLSLSSNDVGIRNQAISCIKEHIHLAAKLDAVVIIGLMKGLVRECDHSNAYWANLKSSLSECLEVAEEKNVVIVLEAINRYESDCLNTIEQCVEFVSQFRTNHLKVHIDTYHMNIEEDRIYENIKKAGAYIGHVHLADSNRCYPGNGHFNFRKLIEVLSAVDYRGALAIECLSIPNQQEAAERAYVYMSELLRA